MTEITLDKFDDQLIILFTQSVMDNNELEAIVSKIKAIESR